MLGHDYAAAADIYSFGIVLAQLSSLETQPYAFEPCSRYLLPFRIAHEGLRPAMPSTCPQWYADLVAACVHTEPDARPTADGIVARLQARLSAGLRRIDDNELVEHTLVASSRSSIVIHGSHVGSPVAIKYFLQRTPRQVNEIVERMAALQSAHTVPLLGVTSAPALVMRYMPFNLRTWLQDGPIGWRRTRLVALRLAEAMAFLHNAGVVHGHLVPTNVFLDADDGVRLSDFGVDHDELESSTIDDDAAGFWTAPERLQGEAASVAADVFGLGLLFALLETQQEPYGSMRENASCRLMQIVAGNLRPLFTSSCPRWYSHLALDCMAHDPSHRPTATQVVATLVSNVEDFL
ncbi:TKL protein kinase [Saprolegnia parasitica CBS 223.65]|uniref:TKL protein kinase n=1 Tax=Saprolegnia parasitica (strain CBS 223.65) TaxID=695850 RepID=A0A067BY68_SAPPC|nr:TKL protein kinase [Saprolegnia parasitica CBS 223.65]KDO19251.1 TKL protein kinase [Saprolegnia parasitica CBS 223.65]|eukprot:XP_012210056.1 TKL protein kinase [Saprolegnia parasitica CBS 223.65]